MKKILLFLLLVACHSRPLPTITDTTPRNWMNEAIDHEFSRYATKGITQEALELTWKNFSTNPDFQRYQIIDSKVYGPNNKLKRLLEVLVQTYPVPNVDFIYYHQDVLCEHFFNKKWAKDSVPILAPAKNKLTDRAVLFVDWYYDIADHSPGSWNHLIKLINENQRPWASKIEKLFWRGSPVDGPYSLETWTNIPRGRLVYESTFRTPGLIDAAFIRVPEPLAQELKPSSFVAQLDQLQYKYHIDIDGVSCTAPSLQWKLLSGSLVLKQTTNDVMWFHAAMIPWKHYIPVHTDLRDVEEKLLWAKSHDEEAWEIGEAGREFAQMHLMPEHILLYCYKTLVKYAALQKFCPTMAKER